MVFLAFSYRTLRLFCLLAPLLLSACASLETVEKRPVSELPNALGNIELHTSLLADELFVNLKPNKHYRYAVATFVPVDSMDYSAKHQSPLMLLGHQLEQGMMTEAYRRGFITQDFKVTNDIIITSRADKVMSRDTQYLSSHVKADYYISGSITEQQGGAIVNARVVHAESKDVIAAATKFFPADLFWQTELVTTRNGMLYRTSSPE